MSSRVFYGQLALERCRQNLAHLCATVYVNEGNDNNYFPDDTSETLKKIVEGLERDLELIEKFLNTPSNALYEEEHAEGVVVDFVQD